jgi:hypothetical protein
LRGGQGGIRPGTRLVEVVAQGERSEQSTLALQRSESDPAVPMIDIIEFGSA